MSPSDKEDAHQFDSPPPSSMSDGDQPPVDSVFNLDHVLEPTYIPRQDDVESGESSESVPSLGLEDEAALDLGGSAHGPPDDSRFEPDTIFDVESDADTPPPARELKIAPERHGYTPKVGDVLNERFEILKLLRGGTLGVVYLVQDLRLKDKKALKLMHPYLMKDPFAADRFIEEIKTLQRLSHEHIVRVYDFGKTDRGDLSYFTMEYVKGVTLDSLLKKKGGRLPVDKALALTRQILDTLVYMHQHGTDRNLRPRNVMIRPTGRIVLLNVGLSGDTAATAQDRRGALGSVHYQAPEQSIDPSLATPQVDIYAVGVLLYQMMTGEVPIGEVLPPSKVNRAVPRRLDRVVMRCLAPKPKNRYACAADVRAALDRAEKPVRFLGVALLLLIVLVSVAIGFFYTST